LEALIGDDAGTVDQFVADFYISAAMLTGELLGAYAAGKTSQVEAQAHKLKLSARAVGALQLGELCAAMERTAKEQDAQALAVLVPAFEREAARVSGFNLNRKVPHVSRQGPHLHAVALHEAPP